MNVKKCLLEYLESKNIELLLKISKNLNACPKQFNNNYPYVISEIIKRLTISIELEKCLRLLRAEKGDYIFEELKKIVLGIDVEYMASYEVLTEWGFLYNDKIPDDLNKLLLQMFKDDLVRTFPNEPMPTKPSTLFKFLMIIQLLNRGINLIEEIKRVNIDNDKIFESIIEFGKEKDFFKGNSNEYYLNRENVDNWLKEYTNYEKLKGFYEWFFYYFSIKITIDKLIEVSNLQDEWYNWLEYEKVKEYMKVEEISCLENLGLLRVIEVENNKFTQLTPEGLYLAKQEIPSCWNKKEIIVSEDNQMFIPHTFNPFTIFIINGFCELKFFDYFIVFNLHKQYIIKSGFYKINCLSNYLNNIDLEMQNGSMKNLFLCKN